MDENLRQEIDDAYKSIFLESKLFKSKNAVASMDIKDVADYAFMSVIALWIMYNEPVTSGAAAGYADRTASFGNFKAERNMATDLYVALNTLIDPESTISKRLADQAENVADRRSIRVNQLVVKTFLDDMASRRLDSTDAARFLLKFERMLNIKNMTYRSIRRLAQEWNAITPHERNLVMTRMLQYFNLHAKRSELKPLLDDLALTGGYKLDRIDKPDQSELADKAKLLALAAASMYGGYRLGKALIDPKALLK